VPLARVNVDEEAGIAARYDVLSIPTVILFAEGEAKETLVGARPAGHFREKFAGYL